jgi:cytochrome c oxidase subunit III
MLFLMKLAQDRRSEQGAWLFLVSLAIFFFSCVLLYAIYVISRVTPTDVAVAPFYLPRSFVLTTVVLIAISVLLHLAVGAVRRERRVDLWRYVILASLLSVVFFIVQAGGMSWMISELELSTRYDRSLYAFSFVLVLIHAVHVVGGAAGLTFILFGLSRGAYDHERHWPIRFCALYWHFLDIVWILMMASFALAAFASK